MAHWVTVTILLAAAAHHVAGQGRLCTLTLQVAAQQSPWTSDGDTTVPFPATIRSPPLNAVGKVYVQVPTTSRCPPEELTAANAASLIERSSLVLPINDSSITFKPVDIKGNVVPVDSEPGTTPKITFDFDGLGLGFTGRPRSSRYVVVWCSTAAGYQLLDNMSPACACLLVCPCCVQGRCLPVQCLAHKGSNAGQWCRAGQRPPLSKAVDSSCKVTSH